jgi:acetyl-CoA hydrolase
VRVADLDLARWVRPGDTVVWGQACGEPLTLTRALLDQRAAIGPFRCFLGIPATDTAGPQYAGDVSFVSYCGTGANAALHRVGGLEILPVHYSALPGLFRDGTAAADVALVQVAPAQAGGYPIGLSEDYLSAAIDAARVVIAEVNDQVPAVAGARRLRAAEIDVMVATSRPPAPFAARPPGPALRRVAAGVAELIDDGATVQAGIGGLADALWAALAGHRDLGVHSGMISGGIVDLVTRGVVTNRRKTIDPGVSVAGLLLGDGALFELARDNPQLQLRPADYTHRLSVLAAIDNFVAVNAALEVDLLGQVNTERIGPDYIGAVGGCLDFSRGAAQSRGGLPVFALPSVSRGESRIVARVRSATVPAADAGIVVTEHGRADLRGTTVPRRAELMIGIAHPDHRAALERQWHELRRGST